MTPISVADLILTRQEGVLWILALGLGAGVVVGFERYRSHFRRGDLLVALVSLFGLVGVLAFALEVPVDWIVDGQRGYALLVGSAFVAFGLYVRREMRSNRISVQRLTRSLAARSAPTTDGGEIDVVVVLPAHDAGASVGRVVADIPDSVRGRTVQPIVVTNRGADRTTQRAAAHGARVVEHPACRGRGDALRLGFEIADRSEASAVVTMSPDGRHDPERIPDVVDPLLDDEADLVIGSRVTGGGRLGLLRRLGVWALAALLGLLTKAGVSDPTSEFRAIRGPELSRLRLSATRFGAPELIVEARKKRLRTTEVPAGADQVDRISLRAALGLVLVTLAAWLR